MQKKANNKFFRTSEVVRDFFFFLILCDAFALAKQSKAKQIEIEIPTINNVCIQLRAIWHQYMRVS